MWNGVEFSWIIYTHLILIIYFFFVFQQFLEKYSSENPMFKGVIFHFTKS